MKLRYRTAVVGFCPDLTDPRASSVPVASLLVGETEGEQLGAAVVVLPPEKQLPLDDLSRMMLGDVPALLRRHLDEVMQALPSGAPLDRILYSLHDGLRNSLQVLKISEEMTLEVVKDASFLQAVVDRGIAVLREALDGIGVQPILWPELDPGVRLQPASGTVRTLPQTSVWPLREAFA